MDDFTAALLDVLENSETQVVAWCVLPNHYHALIETPIIAKALFELGQMHGRLSFVWN